MGIFDWCKLNRDEGGLDTLGKQLLELARQPGMTVEKLQEIEAMIKAHQTGKSLGTCGYGLLHEPGNYQAKY